MLPYSVSKWTHQPQTPLISADPMLRRPPRHAQQFKDPSLAASLKQRPLRDPLPIRPPHHILEQPALIKPHALPARQQPDAAIEDIIPREIYQRGAYLVPGHEQQVDGTGFWVKAGARQGNEAR